MVIQQAKITATKSKSKKQFFFSSLLLLSCLSGLCVVSHFLLAWSKCVGILFWRQAVDGFRELRTKVYLLNIVFLQLFNFPSESFSLIYYIIYH